MNASGKSVKVSQPYLILHKTEEEEKEEVEGEGGRGEKEGVLYLAGLYERWHRDQADETQSFTILTKTPSQEFKWLHNRMPVVLKSEEDVEGWLNGEIGVEEVVREDWDQGKMLRYVKMEKSLERVLDEGEVKGGGGKVKGIEGFFGKGVKGSKDAGGKVGLKLKGEGKRISGDDEKKGMQLKLGATKVIGKSGKKMKSKARTGGK